MFNFNFNNLKIDASFLRTIRKRDAFVFVMFILLVLNFFGIDLHYLQDEKVKKNQLTNSSNDSITPDRTARALMSLELDETMQELCNKYKAEYCLANVLHNGDSTDGGYHFDKISVIAEGKKTNNRSLVRHIQGWSLVPFKPKFRNLYLDGVVYIPDLSKEKDIYFRKEMAKYCKSIVYVAIYDDRFFDTYKGIKLPHFKGVISWQWNTPTNFSQEEINAMIPEREKVKDYIIPHRLLK